MLNDIRKPGGLVQRCIIVQRDENGFGLTVSGDNPVFVQSVKEGSAAAKAGVQVSDQIIKVNGVLVAQSNHIEVVRLIKSGSFVALTLLGKDNSSRSPETNSPNSSRPSSAGHSRSRSLGNNLGLQTGNPSSPPADSKKQESKVNDLKRMLTLEHDLYKKILEEYMRHPTAKAQQELADSQTRIHTVEQQLKALTGSIPPKPQGFHSSAFKPTSQAAWARTPPQARSHSTPGPGNPYSPTPQQGSPLFTGSAQENGNLKSPTKIPNSTSSTSIDSNLSDTKKQKMDEADGHNFPFVPQPVADINSAIADTSTSFDALFAKAKQDNLASIVPLHSAASVISMEDDEFDSDEERFDDHGPFIDLNVLKDRPAHLAVFLHFLMSNSNPVPLLFWLVTDVYSQETGSAKDLKRWAYEIYSTFIANNAPLKVIISEPEEVAVEEAFNPKTSEERFKGVFDVSRSIIFIEVNEQLADFRNKRALGLGGLFGDHQLEDNLDRNKELKVIDQTLLPHLDALMNDSDTSNEQNDRNFAMAAALSTFLRQVGLPTKCRSFVEKEKGSFMSFGSKNKKVHKINGHQFLSMQYTTISLCNFCDKLMWGIAPQGYQCNACEYNVHKHPCSESLTDLCTGKRIRPPKPKTLPKSNISKSDKLLGNIPDSKSEEEGEAGEQKPRATSMLDPDKLPVDSSDEQEKDPESRTGTPSSEDPQASSKSSRSMGGYLRNKVPLGKGVNRSESVKSVREPGRNKTRTISTLPGMGKNSDQAGVYGATPFKSHSEQTEPSSTPDSEEEEEPDSDLEVETENINWQSTVVDKKILKKLKSKELKRQEVIHELIHTERTHVRNLKVLHRLFYKPLLRENILAKETIMLIFPNLEELIEIHESILKPMKELVKQSEVIESVGDLMIKRFDGENGLKVKEACANFCRSQKRALVQLKKLQFSKPKLREFMIKQESNDYCRRLKFTDIIASTHQRLVKYPLLLDSINKSTPNSHSDYNDVEKCSKCCRVILNHVNDEIKIAEDKLRLEELSKLIEDKRDKNDKDKEDQKEGEGKFEISEHTLVMEGDLTWKISPNKTLNLHVVLLEDLLVLLQKADNGKFILKNHNTGISTGDNKGHSPIIKLTNIIIRKVAVDKAAFFLVSTSMTGPQIYELVASFTADARKWVANMEKSVEIIKAKDNSERGRRGGLVTKPTAVASPSEERKDLVKQNSSVDEGGNQEEDNLPSEERMAVLISELTLKDEEIKKTLEEKSNIIAEMKGEKSEPSEDKPAKVPNQPLEIVLAAIAQTKRLTEAVNSTLSVNKDSSTPEQRRNIVESTTALQEYLTALLESMQGKRREKETNSRENSVKRSKSLEKPGTHKGPIKQLSEASASASTGALGTVISHSRSHSSPAETLIDINAVNIPAFEIKNADDESSSQPNETNSKQAENLSSSETIESAPPLQQQQQQPQQQEDTHLLMNENESDPPVDYFDI